MAFMEFHNSLFAQLQKNNIWRLPFPLKSYSLLSAKKSVIPAEARSDLAHFSTILSLAPT